MQLVDKLQNDDQIAAILADGMGQSLERQPLEAMPKRANAVGMIVLAGMPFVGPVAGLALDSGGLAEMHSAGAQIQLQSERVGLSIMHEAGFDIYEAPKAWQIAESKKGAASLNGTPSPESIYLLNLISMEYSPAAIGPGKSKN